MLHSRMLLSLAVAAVVMLAVDACRPSTTGPSPPSERSQQSEEDMSGANDQPEENISEDTGQPEGDTSMPLTIQSSAFSNNEPIPVRFTADGEDISPALSWSGVPENARELALIVDDPDAPGPQPWVHWVIYKIPADAGGLPEGIGKTQRPSEPAGSMQGKNSWRNIGYGGPSPPSGVHHYHFKLYALDTALDVAAGLDKDGLIAAMEGHIIAQAELVGTYKR